MQQYKPSMKTAGSGAQAATSRPGPLGCSRSRSPAGSPRSNDLPVIPQGIVLLQVAGEAAGLQRKGGRLQELRVVTRQMATPGEQVMSPINLEDMEIFQHSDSGDAFGAWLHRDRGPRAAGGGPGGGTQGIWSKWQLQQHCGAWVQLAEGLSLSRGCAVVHPVSWLKRVTAVQSCLGASIGQRWP